MVPLYMASLAHLPSVHRLINVQQVGSWERSALTTVDTRLDATSIETMHTGESSTDKVRISTKAGGLATAPLFEGTP